MFFVLLAQSVNFGVARFTGGLLQANAERAFIFIGVLGEFQPRMAQQRAPTRAIEPVGERLLRLPEHLAIGCPCRQGREKDAPRLWRRFGFQGDILRRERQLLRRFPIRCAHLGISRKRQHQRLAFIHVVPRIHKMHVGGRQQDRFVHQHGIADRRRCIKPPHEQRPRFLNRTRHRHKPLRHVWGNRWANGLVAGGRVGRFGLRRCGGWRRTGARCRCRLGMFSRRRGRRGAGVGFGLQLLQLWPCQRAAEITHRPAGVKDFGTVIMHIVEQENARAQPRNDLIVIHVHLLAGFSQRAFQPLQHPILVAFGLQFADEPGTGVGQPLVVNIHGVLRHQNGAQPKRARLFEQGQQGAFGRRFGNRREKAKDFIEIEQGPQTGGPTLAAHPCHDTFQQQRDEEHPLHIRQVRNVKNAVAWFAFGRKEKVVHIEGVAFEPGLKSRRRHEAVERHRQLKAVFLREEGIHIENAQLAHRRILDTQNQFRQVEVFLLTPKVFKNCRQQNRFAALDGVGLNTGQAKQRRHRARNAFAQGFRVRVKIESRRSQTSQNVDGGGGFRAGGVNRVFHAFFEQAHALGRYAPFGKPFTPLRGNLLSVFLDAEPFSSGVINIHPGAEIFGTHFLELQQQICHVAFGVNDYHGHLVQCGFFQQNNTQAGLAASRHADTNGMRGQIAGVVEKGAVEQAFSIEVVFSAEIERTKMFRGGLHGTLLSRMHQRRTAGLQLLALSYHKAASFAYWHEKRRMEIHAPCRAGCGRLTLRPLPLQDRPHRGSTHSCGKCGAAPSIRGSVGIPPGSAYPAASKRLCGGSNVLLKLSSSELRPLRVLLSPFPLTVLRFVVCLLCAGFGVLIQQ